jgi:CheY-like chemotaxis protein
MSQILLVEDHIAMQGLLRELLEWGGHEVALSRTGQEALQLLQASGDLPEVIVSDLTMPHLDGVGLLQAVRQNPAWATVRFIMMSANILDERITPEAIDALDGVLPKPFSLEDFNALLRD